VEDEAGWIEEKQLTRSIGYDGGAVFSHDGKKIVWRGNHPATPETMTRYKDLLKDNLTTPMKMELFIADAGGKKVKQITNFGCASLPRRLLRMTKDHFCIE